MHTTSNQKTADALSRAFAFSLQELSILRLRKLAKHFKKATEDCETRDEFVQLLVEKLSRDQKLAAMRESVLAGVTAMAIARLPDGHSGVVPQEDAGFKYATSTPHIVVVGVPGEIIPSQQHISWAILAGHNTYVDSSLHLQVDERATVVESLYEKDKGLLQIRASAFIAQKIAREWARMAGVKESDVSLAGVKDRTEFHGLAVLLNASVVKCTGELLESRGFDVVSARKHANFKDLVGTPDYDDFQKETAAIDGDIEFQHDGKLVKLGIGIASRSLVFRTYAKEATIQFVYEKLKSYLKL